jgi:hypothetical protein
VLTRDMAAELTAHLGELPGVLDAFDEALRLFRVRLLEDSPAEYLIPSEWLPRSTNAASRTHSRC